MKTTNFRLLATMITLAAVIMIANPADAQRRTTETKRSEKAVKSYDRSSNPSIQNRNTSRNFETRPDNRTKKISNSRDVNRYKSAPDKNRSNNKQVVTSDENRNLNSTRQSVNTNKANPERSRTFYSQNQQNRSTSNLMERKRTSASIAGKVNTRSENYSTNNSRRNESLSISKGNNSPNNRMTVNSSIINENDRRYSPNKNYRGSNKKWTGDYRPSNMNYNYSTRDFYRRYDYNKYHHWDRNWENYHWNANSWRDYYRGYNPYSFKYNKYYYHHYRYGHVLRKFVYPPVVFIHNHNRYYCYDGHFFRYHRRIGYVLVDIPFGFSFDYLPMEYERVYINGYMYFRIGNLFFEYSDFGYRLIHYPERYFSIHVDFAYNNYWN